MAPVNAAAVVSNPYSVVDVDAQQKGDMMRWFQRPFRFPTSVCLLTGMFLGCGSSSETQNSPSQPIPIASRLTVPQEKHDQRSRWVYDNGWFVQGHGKAWFEHNDDALLKRGKAWEFTETMRNEDYVELHEASRGVSVRLSASQCEARWDRDGETAKWQTLYMGQWAKPESPPMSSPQ